jgi:hypothetical protein
MFGLGSGTMVEIDGWILSQKSKFAPVSKENRMKWKL